MPDTHIQMLCMMRGDAGVMLSSAPRSQSRVEKLQERRGEAAGQAAGQVEKADAAASADPPDNSPTVLDKMWQMPDTLIERDGALAIVHISGAMSFGYDVYNWFEGGAWNVQVKAAIEQVAADPGIAAVLFKIDSPGGTCAGMSDVIAACGRLRTSGKQSISVLANEDLCSAAYWIACAVTQNNGKIVATSTAAIGSVGVVAMMYDVSEAFKQSGVRLVAASTGKEKIDGAAGTVVGADVEARVLAKCEELFTDFLGDVALARGLSEDNVRGLNGAYFYGKSAKAKGLIDEVVDASVFISSLRAEFGQGGTYKPGQVAPVKSAAPVSTPSKEEPVMEPATIEQLEAIFPGDGNSQMASLKAKHTVVQAQAERIAQLNKAQTDAATATAAQVAAANAKTLEAETKLAAQAALPPAPQTPPLGNGAAPGATPGAGNHPAGNPNDHQFMKSLRAHAAANKTTPGKAYAAFAAAQPALHQAYVASLPKGSPVPLGDNVGRASASI